MGNQAITTSKELTEYLDFFGLNFNCSVEALEAAKFIKLKENKMDFMYINKAYKVLLNFKLNQLSKIVSIDQSVDFETYKKNYIKDYGSKYFSYPKEFINKDLLNEDLNNVKVIVKDYYDGLRNEKEKDFSTGIDLFYNDYYNAVDKFIHDYLNILNEKNNNKMKSTLDSVLSNYKFKLLDCSLNDLVNNINNDIKNSVKITLDYQRNIKQLVNNKLNKLDYFFKREEISNILSSYYEKIDEFLYNLGNKVSNKIESYHISNDEEKENVIKVIDDLLNKEITEFGDKIQEDIKNKLLSDISNVNDSELYNTLNTKINNALEFEDYSEIYNLLNNKQSNLQNR